MSPLTLQELRLIRWPWCLMVFAGLLPLVRPLLVNQKTDWPEGLALLGFFGGAAIATGLSFRQALQIQPSAPSVPDSVSRHKVWFGKVMALMIAMACAGLIVCSIQTLSGNIVWHELHANAIEPVLLLVIVVCSMGYWTLLARSVVGGILLTIAAQIILYLLLVLFATSIDRMLPANPDGRRLSHEPEIHSALSWFVGTFGLSYAALMLWLGRKRFARMELSINNPGDNRLKSFIRSVSVPTEFCLVMLINFLLAIVASVVWIARHFSHARPMSYDASIPLTNGGVVTGVIIGLLTLSIVLWIGRVRGWTLKTFGLRPSWRWTGAGVIVFLGFVLVQYVIGWLIQGPFHGTVDFHRSSHLTIPFIVLLSTVNPLCEEAIESGYFFHALQRHGIWLTVLTAALFRGFLHATMGISGFVTMFAMGLLYGFVYWQWRQLWPLIIAHGLQMLYALLPKALAV